MSASVCVSDQERVCVDVDCFFFFAKEIDKNEQSSCIYLCKLSVYLRSIMGMLTVSWFKRSTSAAKNGILKMDNKRSRNSFVLNSKRLIVPPYFSFCFVSFGTVQFFFLLGRYFS